MQPIMTKLLMPDFPKLEAPFVRKLFDINQEDYQKHKYKCATSNSVKGRKASLVINQVNHGYEWVFDDPETITVEKLDGINVAIKMEGDKLMAVQNRLEVIDPLVITRKGNKDTPASKNFILEGILKAVDKGYVRPYGKQTGELIGKKINTNHYKMDDHLWYPFSKAVEVLKYKSWADCERTFNGISSWLKDLKSIFDTKRIAKLGANCAATPVFAEGIVFYNFKRKAEGKTYMAKLRRDMFVWFYEPDINILDYNPNEV